MQQETTFGLNQITKPTPMWATWLFRIVLYICSLGTVGVSTLNVGRFGLTDADKLDIVAVLGFVTIGTHALTRMFGITIKPEDYEVRP